MMLRWISSELSQQLSMNYLDMWQAYTHAYYRWVHKARIIRIKGQLETITYLVTKHNTLVKRLIVNNERSFL